MRTAAQQARPASHATLSRAPVEPVREHPAVEAEHHQRDQLDRTEQTDREGGPGELPGLDEQGYFGGISAQRGDGPAGVQQAEVA